MNKQFQLKTVKIKNYRSFYTEQVIDFSTREKINSVIAIYGPNSSGKSNTALALLYIYRFILNSTNANLLSPPYDPFLLKSNSGDEETEFELTLTSRGRNFQYLFAVNREQVMRESLVELSNNFNKPIQIFSRKLNSKTKEYMYSPAASKHGFGKKITTNTRQGSLLITKARESNNEYANLIFDWLAHINILIGEAPELRGLGAKIMLENPAIKKDVIKIFKETDLWLRDLDIGATPFPEDVIKQLPIVESEKVKLMGQMGITIKAIHAIRNMDGDIIGDAAFNMETQESAGTNRLFDLAAPIVDTLKRGMILYLDEFGAHIHPDISRYLLQLFANPTTNPNGAQLIINTHDLSLMDSDGLLGRDNIIFIEKNMAEESIVRPLAQKSIRNNEKYEKRYRQGLYGAKPRIDQRD